MSEPSSAATQARADVSASRQMGALQALRIGLRSWREHPGLAAMLVGTMLLEGVLQGLIIWSLRFVLHAIGGDAGFSATALVWGALLILGLWMARALNTAGGEVVTAKLAHRTELSAMQRVLAKLLTLSVRYFQKNSQGDLLMAFYHDLKGVRFVTLGLGKIVLSVSRLLGLAVAVWVMSPLLAIVGLVAIPAGAAPAYWFGQKITDASRRARDATQSLHDSFLEVISGLPVIRVYGAEAAVRKRARGISDHLYEQMVRHARDASLARLLLEAASGIGMVAVLVVGGREVALGRLDWQGLLSILIAMIALYSPFVNLLSVYNSVRSVLPNLARSEAVFREVPEIRDAPDALPLAASPKTIELRDVWFSYDGEPVLRGLSAEFHRGETIGIVGPSGAGKSTLISLLLRFYDASHGVILFDGTDLRTIRHADILAKTSLVPQEPFLLLDTIANNIRLSMPEATDAAVEAAARAARVHEEIVAMPDGYDTRLGRDTEARQVSVGQKQRIAIATAFLKDAPLLFLDEATSNLDAFSERAIQDAINRLKEGRTTFIVAHRLATIRNADRILVLDDGRLVGMGRHELLLESCSLYRKMWIEQQARGAAREDEDGIPAEASDSPPVGGRSV